MNVQVLVTTMHAQDFSKVEEMNIRNADVVIANQTDRCAYEEMDFPDRGVHAAMISTNTTGAGLNRNIAMAYASADIILFADDDMVFVDNFSDIVSSAMERFPQADGIKFYCQSTNKERPLSFRKPETFHRTRAWKIMSAGVVGLAIRRDRLLKRDVLFPTSIGPGRFYGNGEDNFFYKLCFKAGLSIYVAPDLLSYVNQQESSWFRGCDEHFFNSVGYIYAKLYGKMAVLAIIKRLFHFARKNKTQFTSKEIYHLMLDGMHEYRR